MKDIVILSAGRFSREVYSMIMDCIDDGKQWRFKGFVDDRKNILDDFPHEGEMLGGCEVYEPAPNDYIIPAMGESGVREKYVEQLLAKGARFETLIHPSVYIGKHVSIGEGGVVCHGNILTADIIIGSFVNVGTQCILSHGNHIGDWVSMGGGCCIAGEVKIGSRTCLGCNVTIAPGVNIGIDAYLGIGSVIIHNVCDDAFMFGNPAKKMGKASERVN